MKLIRSALATAGALLVLTCHAQQVLEIIPLRHRTVEQVLPALRPLMEPGSALTGQSNQLIVRASPANLAEIRRALDAIDRPSRRLQIAVRFDDARDAARQSIQGSGRIGGGGARIEIGAQDGSRRVDERIDQRVQVLEGSRAFISTGASRPVSSFGSGTTVIQESATGFAVIPRLSGDRVSLDIAPQRETFSGPGTVQGSRIETTLSARLGEWTEIGGAVEQISRDDRSIASASRSSGSGARQIWIKVEEIRN